MGLREQKKQLMRRQLYESATALFRERGFAAARVKDITERAGVSEATFFNYFPTKESVLLVSELEIKGLYAEFLGRLLARSSEPVVDRVRELVSVLGQVFAADRGFMVAVVGRTGVFFGSTGRAKEMDVENFALLAELFNQGLESGEINAGYHPMQLAEVLTAIFMVTITNWITDWWGDLGDLEPRLLKAVEIFLGGCRAG
ncbi:MAG: TetR/AcrR family transcriptional regulator [Acidimicrobiales bacterium]